MITVVFGSDPKLFGYDIITNETSLYVVHQEEASLFIWYPHFPPSVYSVHSSLLDCDKNTILLIDRIKGWKSPISIKDHVNISGTNGLTGQTPFKSYPIFPDMSSIYKVSSAYPQKTVFTVGGKRFCTEDASKKIISENAGIITPIMNYVGATVTALGLPEKMRDTKKIVSSYIKTAELLN